MTDKELLRITTQFTKGLTGGDIHQKCYMVTLPLHGYLSLIGVNAILIEGEVALTSETWGHFWLKLADGRILDPTAGQFLELGLPRVYLGVLPEQYTELHQHHH